LIVFPPDGIARRSGLVRERFLLLELQQGTVYHLRVPCNWGPLPERLATLAQILIGHEDTGSLRERTASAIGWSLETTLEFVDLDLAAPTTDAWPVRATALQRCYIDSPSGESPRQLAERVALAEADLACAASADLSVFVARLNPDILRLSSLWGCMPWARYNWFASARDEVRPYRIQVARVFPALVPVLSDEFGKPGPVARSLAEVVDRGEPLIDALASTCHVRAVTARHALTMPPVLVEGEKLPTLIRALDWLIPERFPRGLHEWGVFERLVNDTIPKLTARPAASPINLSFLPQISRRGWAQAAKQLARLCVDDETAASVREFLDAYRRSLAWDLMQADCTGTRAEARAACATTVDEALASVGVIRVFEASRSFPALLREANAELAHRHEMLRGERCNNVLEEPMVFDDCEIAPLHTVSALARLGSDLANCLGPRYASECASGMGHIFSIRSATGNQLGALYLRFPVDRYGGFRVQICDCKGPHNSKIGADAWRAVIVFCEWLKTEKPRRRISELRRVPHAPRHAGKSEINERIEMESTIAALGRLRQKSLRFDVLRKKVGDMFALPVGATGVER
jgi:hypothetical protein